MTAKTHMLAPLSAAHRTLCGTSAVKVVETRKLVTCLSCIKLFATLPIESEPVTLLEAMRYAWDVLRGPVVEPYPIAIAPDEWVQMGCVRHGMPMERCGCAWCAWERQYRGRVDEWERSQSLRPHRRYDHPFGSLAAALSFLARWRRDGAMLRSSTGNASARLEAVARLGTEVQTTQRFDRDSLEVERAGFSVTIESALRRALRDEQRLRGLAPDVAEAALLTSVDESLGDEAHPAAMAERLGLTERAMKALLASTRRALTVDLAARGVIPEPRDRAGLRGEIADRRAEIGRAA